MAFNLPGTGGVVSVNGYTLDPAKTKTTAIRLDPVEDSSGRTVKWVDHVFSFETVVNATPPATVDDTIQSIRRQLSSPGGTFVFTGKGFQTDYSINTGAVRDVAWGPKVRNIVMELMGDKHAFRLTFDVHVRIPECTNAKYTGVLEWVFRQKTDISREGYTTLTTYGRLSIAQTRTNQADRRLLHSADEYRDTIRPPTPFGFYPNGQSFVLSEDKCTLDFTCQDVQLPSNNTFPPGVVNAKASMSWSNGGPMNFLSYTVTLDAEYTMAPGLTAGRAFPHFINLAKSRLKAARDEMIAAGLLKDMANQIDPKALKVLQLLGLAPKPQQGGNNNALNEFNGIVVRPNDNNQNAVGDKVMFLPMSFRATEPDIYGPPRTQFSIQWRTIMALPAFLTAGLWKPVPEAGSWAIWKKSLDKTAFSPRGQAGLEFDVNSDVIVDLCREKPRVGKLRNNKDRIEVAVIPGAPSIGAISPRNSWLEYQCGIHVQPKSGVVVHRPLPKTATLKTPALLAGANPFGTTDHPEPTNNRLRAQPDAVIQDHSGTYFEILLVGSAVRAGWEVTPPEILKVGGQDAVPADDPARGDYWSTTVAAHCGVPVYAARWQRRFVIANRPDKVTSPPNPMFFPGGVRNESGDLDQFAASWES